MIEGDEPPFDASFSRNPVSDLTMVGTLKILRMTHLTW